MTHPNRRQLEDTYASTQTIAVIGASADPEAAVLARRIG
jgi:predicted CoA-binding protein